MPAEGSANISALADALRQSGKDSHVTTQQVLVQAAGYMLSEMEALVPVRTGNLRSSLGIQVIGMQVVIGPDAARAPYAGYVEFGTKPHVIKAKNKRSLAFRVGGQTVFVKQVNHPGTRAQPYVKPAFDKWVDSLGAMAAAANIKTIAKNANA